MKLLCLLSATLLGLAGCAASGPAADNDATPVGAAGDLTGVANAAASADDDQAADDATGSVLEVAEIPRVQSTADTPPTASVAAQRVCRLEKRTGSNRAIRVCRTRAEIDRLETESKERFRELHRSQTEYQY